MNCPAFGVFLLKKHHEYVTDSPQGYEGKRHPTRNPKETHNRANVLWISEVAEGELLHPWKVLPKAPSVVYSFFPQQIIHPAINTGNKATCCEANYKKKNEEILSKSRTDKYNSR